MEIHNVTAVGGIDEIDDLTIHLAPVDDLLAKGEVDVSIVTADIGLANDPFELGIVFLVGGTIGVEAVAVLKVVGAVILEIVNVDELDVLICLVFEFELGTEFLLLQPPVLVSSPKARIVIGGGSVDLGYAVDETLYA
ncbi:hypothetical protein [Geotalea toluenoxydans]|uniref:hypothetical protein n=1 Tax=Geotalea toluenoxydans TaxID=421624 RepID=UPI001FB36799|nr:hypothetical protein [Geotalea toluenoxydans]